MPNERKTASRSGTGFDPTEAWRQWYDNAAKVWANTLGGSRETYLDPFGVYRLWLKGAGERGESAMPEPVDPGKLWKDWFDATTGVWRKAAEAGQADPLGLTKQWLEMMDQTRAKMTSQEGAPPDPLSFFREWYDRTSETWSKVIGDAIGAEAFMESASRYLDVYTSYYKSLRQTAETQLHNLQIPTRSDVARVAGLVVALEDKVDRLEDAFERFENSQRQSQAQEPAPALSALEERVDRVEAKLDALLAAVERLGANGRDAGEQRTPTPAQESKESGSERAGRTPPRRTRRAQTKPTGE